MLGRPLKGDLVHLSVLAPPDLDKIHGWWSQSDLVDALVVTRPVMTPKAMQVWFEQVATDDSTVIWGITANTDLVGVTRFFDIDWVNRHAASETIIAVPDVRGRGFATEAIALRTRYAFQTLGLMHLEAMVISSNTAIAAALQKSQYRKVGTREKYVFRGGSFHDVDLYAVTLPDWKAAAAAAHAAAQTAGTAAAPAAGPAPAPQPAPASPPAPDALPAAAPQPAPVPRPAPSVPAGGSAAGPGHPPYRWRPPGARQAGPASPPAQPAPDADAPTLGEEPQSPPAT